MRKKLMALLLASSMIMTMVGCGSKETDQTTESTVQQESSANVEEESTGITFPLEEPIEVSVYCVVGNEAAGITLENTWIMQHMEKMTNVKLNVTNVTYDDANQNQGLMFSAGDYPDVLIKSALSPEKFEEYGKEGIFIDLTDLLKEYAPNYCAMLDAQDGWESNTSSNGEIYAAVEYEKTSILGPHMMINQKWLDNLGLKMPTSTEEFYEVLKAFRDEDANGNGDPNDEIPMMFASGDILPVEAIWNFFGINHGDWNDYYEITDEGEGRYFPVTEEFKEILAYLTKLYEEELINPDCMTIKREQQIALGTTGTPIGVFFDWGSWATLGNYVKGENDWVLDYVPVYPFEQNGGKYVNASVARYGTFAITDKCEYPEIMVAWMDYLYSYEGSMISTYGFEGEQYEIVDGMVKYIGDWNPETVRPYLLHMGGSVFKPCNSNIVPALYIDPNEQPQHYQRQELYDDLAEKDLYFDLRPTVTYTEEEAEKRSTIATDCNDYFLNYRARVITGEIDLDDTWDEYIETMEKMGASYLTETYNAALKRATE